MFGILIRPAIRSAFRCYPVELLNPWASRPGMTKNVETAALLHDIGKIDEIYMDILRKTGATQQARAQDDPISRNDRRRVTPGPFRPSRRPCSVRFDTIMSA